MAEKKRTASNSSRASGKRRASAKASASSAAKQPIRREVGAAVCLLVALLSSLGYFIRDGLFIQWLRDGLKGLFGYGYYIVPPVLVLAFFILAFHHGRPVRLRLVCALLLPLLVSMLLHLFLAGSFVWETGLIPQLWKSGIAGKSGGAVAGTLAVGGKALLSVPGTAVLVVIALCFAALAAFNCTLSDVV